MVRPKSGKLNLILISQSSVEEKVEHIKNKKSIENKSVNWFLEKAKSKKCFYLQESFVYFSICHLKLNENKWIYKDSYKVHKYIRDVLSLGN